MPTIAPNLVQCFIFRRGNAGVSALLLHRHPNRAFGGLWQPVTGGIEPGESTVDAALREIREETGLTPIALWHADFVMLFFDRAGDRVIVAPVFAAEIAFDATLQINADEHIDHRWIAADELSTQLIWPQQRQAWQEIMTEIITPSAAEPLLRIALPP